MILQFSKSIYIILMENCTTCLYMLRVLQGHVLQRNASKPEAITNLKYNTRKKSIICCSFSLTVILFVTLKNKIFTKQYIYDIIYHNSNLEKQVFRNPDSNYTGDMVYVLIILSTRVYCAMCGALQIPSPRELCDVVCDVFASRVRSLL